MMKNKEQVEAKFDSLLETHKENRILHSIIRLMYTHFLDMTWCEIPTYRDVEEYQAHRLETFKLVYCNAECLFPEHQATIDKANEIAEELIKWWKE